jgi:AcrR family transcriptional regulator
MSRPITIHDEIILAAARDVFLEHGIRATSAEVAKRANVSEGTLFKRFKTKDGLFEAAMTQAFHAEAEHFVGSLLGRVGRGELQSELEEVAVRGIEFFRKIVALNMMQAANPGRSAAFPPRTNEHGEHRAIEGRRLFEAYFEAEKRTGRLRNVDAAILARSFMGALYNFAAMEVMLGPSDPEPMDHRHYAKGLVKMLLHGVAAPKKEPAVKSVQPRRAKR